MTSYFILLKIPNKILVTEEGVTKTFTCARTLVGQHVFLQLVGVEGSLSVCEVEVFTTNGEKWWRVNTVCIHLGDSPQIFRVALQSPSMEMSG